MRSKPSLLLAPVVWATVVWALVVAAAWGDVAERDRLLGTGSHTPRSASRDVAVSPGWGTLWTSVVENSTVVRHLAGTANATTYSDVFRVQGVADGIAACGDRVWITFPPSAQRPNARDVLAFATRRNPATGLTYADPPTGNVLPSLRADRTLVGFAADGDGPWALFQGTPSERFGARRTDASAEPPATVPNLLQRWTRGAWVDVPLPAAVERAPTVRLAVIDGAIALVTPDPRGGTALHLWGDGDAAPWRRHRLDVSAHDATFIDAAGRPAVAWLEGRQLHVAYLRGLGDPTVADGADLGLLEWATLATPEEDWLFAGDAAGAVMLTGGTPPLLRRLPAIADQAGPLVALERPGFRSGSWIHVPILGAIVVAALVAFALARGVGGGEEEDAREAPFALPLERRLAALLVDFIPGALVAILALHASPLELLVLPSWSLDRDATEPASLAILVTCAHSTLFEAFTGRSLGKLVVGARVVSIDSSKLGVSRALVRGLLKFVTLCVPILGVFVLLSAARRSIGDAVARAIVIDTRAPRPPAES
ncbi:MAG: RDD family protein [Phycisphaerae bacterium]|nr:RDD family protein [Phycisphaerae bacterium]